MDGTDFGVRRTLKEYTNERSQVSWRSLEHVTASARKVAWRVAGTLERICGSQDTVNNGRVQTGRGSSIVSPGNPPSSPSSGTMQSSSSGAAMAAGGPAPEDSNVAVDTVVEKFDDTADDEINDSGDRDWRSVQGHVRGCWQAGQIEPELT